MGSVKVSLLNSTLCSCVFSRHRKYLLTIICTGHKGCNISYKNNYSIQKQKKMLLFLQNKIISSYIMFILHINKHNNPMCVSLSGMKWRRVQVGLSAVIKENNWTKDNKSKTVLQHPHKTGNGSSSISVEQMMWWPWAILNACSL